MPDLRKSTSEDRLAIKALFRQGLALYGGGEYFKDVTRVGTAQLSRYHTAEHDDKHCPIDVVLDLELEIGKPLLTEFVLKRQGYGIHRVDPAEFSAVPMIAKMGRLTRQFAGMVETVSEAGADNHYDQVEVAACRAQIAEMQKALETLDARLAHEGGQGGNVVPVRKVGGDRNG